MIDLRTLTPQRLLVASVVVALLTIGLKTAAWWVTDSVGLLSDAMESAVNRFVQKPQTCTEETAAKVEKAGFALVEYLELVLSNKPVHPVALFAQYRDVQEITGAERVHPADLWPFETRGLDIGAPASGSALQVDARLLSGPRVAQWPGLLWLALATAAGALCMTWLKRTNPWFMGALLVSMGLTLSGVYWSAVPTALSNAAQLVIGVSLGVRFQREFVHTAPRWLASVATGTAVMMVLSVGFGLALAWATGLHPATLILGTSPGGIAEMAITAKVLQLGVPVVTAFQVCRLVAVLILVGPIFQWLGRHPKPV